MNNVGNAFTPFGSGDPLQAASWGVGIYQAGTVTDAMTLYGCVSWLARRAIGLEESTENKDVVEGTSLRGMLLVKNKEHIVREHAVKTKKKIVFFSSEKNKIILIV